ncbi:hypothetical protein CG740_23170 [Streptomyces sp. CB01201]|uniref:hypothetical protein n=1 Tax=Streptomyces sp. CB01201 TaxID=2020324 RepID=UPI000C27C3C9|nr:hypothetical protein [Streptomyces sp. CB01201]PJN00810.1 hypothetical protein CG740_23170 [Streptomyces sp. CB01201]
MGLFTPKYPKSDTPGTDPQPLRRESRADRKQRETSERIDAALKQGWQNAERASKERSARFWDDYERLNGKGSVEWS